jgi:hypothetical protein
MTQRSLLAGAVRDLWHQGWAWLVVLGLLGLASASVPKPSSQVIHQVAPLEWVVVMAWISLSAVLRSVRRLHILDLLMVWGLWIFTVVAIPHALTLTAWQRGLDYSVAQWVLTSTVAIPLVLIALAFYGGFWLGWRLWPYWPTVTVGMRRFLRGFQQAVHTLTVRSSDEH